MTMDSDDDGDGDDVDDDDVGSSRVRKRTPPARKPTRSARAHHWAGLFAVAAFAVVVDIRWPHKNTCKYTAALWMFVGHTKIHVK